MARVIQHDPFVQQIAPVEPGTGSYRRGLDRADRYLATAQNIANSPVTKLLLRGGQAVGGAISDYLADASQRRLDEYAKNKDEFTLDQDLSAPEEYKPMPGLSLRGDQPEGLGLSLDRGELEAPGRQDKPALGLSLRGDQPEGLGLSLDRGEPEAPIKRDVIAESIRPAFSAPPPGMDITSNDERVAGVFLADAAKKRLAKQSALQAYNNSRIPGLENDKAVMAIDSEPTMPAGPSLPRVPRAPRGAGLPTAEELGNARRNPSLSLSREDELALVAPRNQEFDFGEEVVVGKRPRNREFDFGEEVVIGQRPRVMPELPRVPRTPSGTLLPTAEELGRQRREPPLSLGQADEFTPSGQQAVADSQGLNPSAGESNKTNATGMWPEQEWRNFLADEGIELPEVPSLAGQRPLKSEPEELPEVPEVQSGDFDTMLARAATSMGRSGRLSRATRDQLLAVRERLLESDDQTSRERLAQIDNELTARNDRERVAQRALTPEELLARASTARTAEEQAQIIRDSARVRLPLTSIEDLIGDNRERRFRQELNAAFPSAPRKSEGETLADIEAKLALAEFRRSNAGLRGAQGAAVAAKSPAEVAELEARAMRAMEQGGTEAFRREELGARAELAREKSASEAAMRDPRVRKLGAESDRLAASTDKLRAQIAAIKSRRAGGGGGGSIAQDLKALKTVKDVQSGALKDANTLVSEGMKAARDAADDARAAELKLAMVPAPGAEPPALPGEFPASMPEQERKALIERRRKWEASKGAYDEAVKNLINARASKVAADTAVQSMIGLQRDAASAAKEYDAVIGAVRGRIERKMGVKPAPAAAPAAASKPKVKLWR